MSAFEATVSALGTVFIGAVVFGVLWLFGEWCAELWRWGRQR